VAGDEHGQASASGEASAPQNVADGAHDVEAASDIDRPSSMLGKRNMKPSDGVKNKAKKLDDDCGK